MARPGGQLERSLAALTVGVAKGQQARARSLTDTRTGEWEQQVHVNLAGKATSAWGFSDHPVHWEYPFLYAPMQRRVPFQTPHFTYGIEMQQAPDLIVIHAHVLNWTQNRSAWIVGAVMRFAVQAPNAGAPVSYSAVAHLSFQGYAGLAQGDEFDQ